MTLLEAVVALVILGLSAIGLLEGLQVSSRAERDAIAWNRAAAIAQAAVIAADDATLEPLPTGFTRTVAIHPWRGDVSEIVATVTTPHGASFVLHRLQRENRRSDP